jgi:hypothetical protein
MIVLQAPILYQNVYYILSKKMVIKDDKLYLNYLTDSMLIPKALVLLCQKLNLKWQVIFEFFLFSLYTRITLWMKY